MTIKIEIPELVVVVGQAVGDAWITTNEKSSPIAWTSSFDGLLLLKHYDQLQLRLAVLQTSPNPRNRLLSRHLSLLVDGFLADHEPFASFGYQELFQQEYITLARWQSIQLSRFKQDINVVENSLYILDDAENPKKQHRAAPMQMNYPELEPTVSLRNENSDCLQGFAQESGLAGSRLQPFVDAVVRGDMGCVQHLIDVDGFDANVAVPIALQTRNLQLVEWLLNRGADCRFLTSRVSGRHLIFVVDDGMMLMEAVQMSYQCLVRTLLDLGSNFNATDVITGESALLTAVKRGKLGITQLLLERGANANGTGNPMDEVPLVVAGGRRDMPTIGLLLQHGAAYDTLASNQQVPEQIHRLIDYVLNDHDSIEIQDYISDPAYLQEIYQQKIEYEDTENDDVEDNDISMLQVQNALIDVKELEEIPNFLAKVPIARTASLSLEQLWCLKSEVSALSPNCQYLQAEDPFVHTLSFLFGEPPCAPIAADRIVLRTRLSGSYGSPEHALFMAAADGHYPVVYEILRSAQQFDKQAKVATVTLLDNGILNSAMYQGDSSLGNLTVLMAAVRKRDNCKVVRSLLQYGLDVNTLTLKGTALSLAAETGCSDTIRLLLRHGADVDESLFALSTIVPPTMQHSNRWDNSRAIQRLTKLSSLAASSDELSHLPKREIAQVLRSQFLREHSQLLKAASPGPSFTNEECPDWTISIETKSRKAWHLGFRVFKRLIAGILPATIHDTIMFLVVVKAISATKDTQNNELSGYGAQFLGDLSRWQMLFAADPSLLKGFQDAIYLIWRIELDLDQEIDPPDAESLLQLQQMVLNLVDHDLLDLGNQEHLTGGGLLASQHRWRLMSQESYFIPSMNDLGGSTTPITNQRPDDDPGNLEDDALDYGSLRDILSGLTYGNLSPLVVFLLAGAIFGILVAFLVGMILHFTIDTSLC